MEQKEKICFACATIYEAQNADVLVCPHCGHQVSLKEYEKILNNVRAAVHYGWNYRLAYEKQLQEDGEIHTYYYLAPYEEIINYVALAIASGIIGGFAYDVVKKVISKISEFAKNSGRNQDTEKLFALIENEENMKKFMLYMDEYYACFEAADETFRSAILEEMLVDQCSSTLEHLIQETNPNVDMDWIKKISPFSEAELFKGMLEVMKNHPNKRDCDKQLFQSFWSHIDD